jgi:hypothetical protein
MAALTVTQAQTPKAGVTLAESVGKTEVVEGGAGDSYQMVLDLQPTADVTITLSVPAGQLQTDKNSVTFTTANWNVPQLINVTAVDDAIDEGLHTASLNHTVSSTDSEYNGVPVPEVVVSITDNDKAGVTIIESGGKTEAAEGGAGDSYQMVLDAQPTGDVTITLSVPTIQLQASPLTLTFTPGNWNVAQTVNVTAVDDAVDEGLHAASITHAAASADSKFDEVTVSAVEITLTDNDAVLLRLVRVEDTVILSWSVNSTGFALEENENLSNPNSWTPTQETPIVLGDTFTVTKSLNANAMFFRLRK